jgi:magnesium-transporting ATPase (P-type)
MFITGWANNNFIRTWTTTTLSEMIATVWELKPIFGVWYGFYAPVNLVVIGLFLKYSRHHTSPITDGKIHYHRPFCSLEGIDILTSLYILCTLAKLTALPCIVIYDTTGPNARQVQHMISATITFITALIACVCLFLRRFFLKQYYHTERGTVTCCCEECTQCDCCSWKLFLVINCVWILAGIAVLIGFAVNSLQGTGGGLWEFFLCLFLVSDVLFQIADFGLDPKSLPVELTLEG